MEAECQTAGQVKTGTLWTEAEGGDWGTGGGAWQNRCLLRKSIGKTETKKTNGR